MRAVLLTGAGGAFCAGAELAEPGAEVPEPADEILRRYYNPVILSLREMPKPVVVAVNGVAVGAGMSLAMAGDILVAADSASFSCAFSRVGLAPDAGSSHFLPRAVGYHRALALMLLSPRIDADAALASGLVWRIFPAPELSSVARQIAQQLASGATQAFALTKQALLASATNALAEQLELEAALQMQAVATSDFTEGVAAFRQRRSPKFKGR